MKRKRGLAGLAVAIASSLLYGGGLLNPDFENETGGEFGGWKIPSNGPWKIVAGEGVNGTRALVYENESDKVPYCWVTQEVSIEGGRHYTFETWLRTENIRCDMQGATIFINWRNPDGKKGEFWGMGAQKGTHDQWAKCGASVFIPKGVTSVRVNLILRKGSLGKACFDNVLLRAEMDKPVIAVVASSYRRMASTGREKFTAVLGVDTEKTPLQRLSGSFEWRGGDGRIRVAAPQTMTDKSATIELDVVRDIAMGVNSVAFTLKDLSTGKVIGSATNLFSRVSALPERKVYIDSHGRCIVDGKPFFPLGFYCTTIDGRLMKHLVDTPFNVLMPYDRPRTAKPLDLAHAQGVKVLYSLIDYFAGSRHAKHIKNEADEYKAIKGRVDSYKNHPAILGWYMSDEKPIAAIGSMVRHAQWMEDLDPDHPTWTVLLTSGSKDVSKYIEASDVLGSDPYPIGLMKEEIGLCSETTRQMVAGTFGARGIWQVPQVFDWTAFRPNAKTDWGARAPTRDEMANMFWQCIAEGANGLIAYTLNERHLTVNGRTFDDRWPEIVSVGRDIKAKESILLSIEPAPKIVSKPVGISARIWSRSGRLHLLAVNSTRNSVTGEIRLSNGDKFIVSLKGIEVTWVER